MKKRTTGALLALVMPFLPYCKKSSDPGKTIMVTTIAGTGESGYVDGKAAVAQFSLPVDIAVHTDGTLYIADLNNRRIRKLDVNGQVFTVAGNGNYANINGPVATASFKGLHQIALDASGDVFILDGSIQQIRKITGGIDVSVFAGTGLLDFADGPADSAHFSQPGGITIDGTGKVYIADTWNHRIRKIANSYVNTIAGTAEAGHFDSTALQSQFFKPRGIAVDKQGNIYVCDQGNFRIRKITPTGNVSTLAGSGIEGDADGDARIAQFAALGDMVIDNNGNLYVIDAHRIRKIRQTGDVTTIAGDTPGFADGEGRLARFRTPLGLGIDPYGNIYVADCENERIRKISFK